MAIPISYEEIMESENLISQSDRPLESSLETWSQIFLNAVDRHKLLSVSIKQLFSLLKVLLTVQFWTVFNGKESTLYNNTVLKVMIYSEELWEFR